jgi:hypothetical protein
MKIEDRINAFTRLGEEIIQTQSNSPQTLFWENVRAAHIKNPWFTPEFSEEAIIAIAKKWLTKKTLLAWISTYPKEYFRLTGPKTIGVVMAGNIPFVGFHDFLCVLISGHRFMGKISSKDGGLMQAIVDMLIGIEPRFSEQVVLTENFLQNFNAVIATGNDNSARYFDYYFGKYPNIIRRNRHSVAVLTGNENDQDIQELAKDIFTFFGLGCRNVSTLLVPADYDLTKLFQAFEPYKYLINHNKYANNYEYHRAIYIMNGYQHLDNGFVLLKPDEALGSPVGVLFYQYYTSIQQVNEYIESHGDSLQCIVSQCIDIDIRIAFGATQQPEVADYADGVDTIEFLGNL